MTAMMRRFFDGFSSPEKINRSNPLFHKIFMIFGQNWHKNR